ncbi:unnamed protein product [Paramecium primaurelia]|uniref:Transmembrane protein n=1 Tax=Paramecium primaurelia TaxID=5886 RepID=A0A8S1K201_PARPR|nr:unnamed protein product [Paramecium primaurelia]
MIQQRLIAIKRIIKVYINYLYFVLSKIVYNQHYYNIDYYVMKIQQNMNILSLICKEILQNYRD